MDCPEKISALALCQALVSIHELSVSGGDDLLSCNLRVMDVADEVAEIAVMEQSATGTLPLRKYGEF
jgi:hypothetical protein